MAASTVIQIDHTDDIPGLAGGTRKEVARALINALEAYTSGAKRATTLAVHPNDNEALVRASGTITCAAAADGDTVTIAGVVFTGETGSPGTDEFDISLASDALVAADLARCINASTDALLAGIVSASASDAVVTVTVVQAGRLGNHITLASSNGTRLAVSAARLTGGTGGVASRTAVTF